MTDFKPEWVSIQVQAAYLPSHSLPAQHHYAFAYTVTIANGGNTPVQLLSRHWIITDADSGVEEVRGDGVVGEQPVIVPGGHFRYTSGATLTTPVGYMAGSYTMIAKDGAELEPTEVAAFEVPIPPFTLHTPTALN